MSMRIYITKEGIDWENWEDVEKVKNEIEKYQGRPGGLLYLGKDVRIVENLIFAPQTTIHEDGEKTTVDIPRYSIENSQELTHVTALDVTVLY